MHRARRFVKALDSIDLYLNITYFVLLCWGIDMLITGARVSMISSFVPPIVYQVWVLAHVVAPLASWTGQLTRHYRRNRFGWELRWGADAGVCLILVTALIALGAGDQPELIYRISAYVLLCILAFVLTIRDVTHIIYRERSCEVKTNAP